MPPRINEVTFRGFVQIELNEDDFTKLDNTSLTGDEILLRIASLCSQGYRISATADREAKRVKVTLMDTDTTRSSAGWMLSAEAESLIPALIVILYKHEAKMGNDWRPFCNSTRQASRYR